MGYFISIITIFQLIVVIFISQFCNLEIANENQNIDLFLNLNFL
jgi:hypothetical protein